MKKFPTLVVFVSLTAFGALGEDLAISPATGFSASGVYGGPFSPTSLNLTLTNTGVAALNWSLANPAAWLSASISSGSLTPGGPATTVTVSLTSAATNLFVGDYTANIWITNLNDNVAQAIPFSLTVEQLILNGGFETGDFTDWTLNGDSSLTEVTSNPTYFPPHSGSYMAVFGSTNLNYITQTIATIPGTNYQVSFWIVSIDTGPVDNEILFNWNGQTLFDEKGITDTAGWTNLQFTVTATSSSTVVEFGGYDNDTFVGLDDVSVQPVAPVVVPVPIFESIVKAGNAVDLTWSSVSGLVYQLQYSTNLAQTNWLNLSNSITATNSTTSISIPLGGPQQFYRVEVMP